MAIYVGMTTMKNNHSQGLRWLQAHIVSDTRTFISKLLSYFNLDYVCLELIKL